MLNNQLIIIIGVIAAVFVLFVYLWSPSAGSERFSCEGVYVESTLWRGIPMKRSGDKVFENLKFKIGPEKTILMSRKKGEPNPISGQKAKIYYKLGKCFQNNVYLDYEWIK